MYLMVAPSTGGWVVLHPMFKLIHCWTSFWAWDFLNKKLSASYKFCGNFLKLRKFSSQSCTCGLRSVLRVFCSFWFLLTPRFLVRWRKSECLKLGLLCFLFFALFLAQILAEIQLAVSYWQMVLWIIAGDIDLRGLLLQVLAFHSFIKQSLCLYRWGQIECRISGNNLKDKILDT